MISINATLIVQVIHFSILTFILNRLMFRPILKLINDRKQYAEKTRDEIKKIELKTDRLRHKYLSIENDARKNVSEERVQLRNKGLSDAEEFLKDSRKEVGLIRNRANKEAEGKIEETRPLLYAEAAVLADEIAEMLIGRRVED